MKKTIDYLNNHFFITLVIVNITIFFLLLIIDYTQENYYLLYPKLSNLIAWFFLTISILVFLFSLFQLIKRYLNKPPVKSFFYLSVFSISGLFLLNIVQFQLYLSSPRSYIVDDRIRNYHVSNEINDIDNLRYQYQKEINISNELLIKIPDENIRQEYQQNSFVLTNPTRTIEGKYLKINDINIFLRLFHYGLPDLPGPAERGDTIKQRNVTCNVLNIVYSNCFIEICKIQLTNATWVN